MSISKPKGVFTRRRTLLAGIAVSVSAVAIVLAVWKFKAAAPQPTNELLAFMPSACSMGRGYANFTAVRKLLNPETLKAISAEVSTMPGPTQSVVGALKNALASPENAEWRLDELAVCLDYGDFQMAMRGHFGDAPLKTFRNLLDTLGTQAPEPFKVEAKTAGSNTYLAITPTEGHAGHVWLAQAAPEVLVASTGSVSKLAELRTPRTFDASLWRDSTETLLGFHGQVAYRTMIDGALTAVGDTLTLNLSVDSPEVANLPATFSQSIEQVVAYLKGPAPALGAALSQMKTTIVGTKITFHLALPVSKFVPALLSTSHGIELISGYVRHSKTAEARTNLAIIAKGASASYSRERLVAGTARVENRFCNSAPAPIPPHIPGAQPLPAPPFKRDPDGGWYCVQFEFPYPVYYQYQFHSNGKPGADATFEALARGDLNEDGAIAIFGVRGKIVNGAVEIEGPKFLDSTATGWSETSAPGVTEDE